VLSFEAGEGRTVTTLALAAAAADRGLKTLVLDATTFERLGAVSLEETLGVAEASGTGPQASPVFPGVDYVTCFVRDGIRLAEGRAELERLTQGYDLALIDTAALNTHNRGNVDPQLCARLADGALLVAAGDGPLAEGSKATIDDMKRLGVRFFGVVGNGASR
jgi:Mrp family chromosome partitioning ATPase